MIYNNEDEYVDDEPNYLGAGLNDVIGSRYYNIGQISIFDDESSFNMGEKYATFI